MGRHERALSRSEVIAGGGEGLPYRAERPSVPTARRLSLTTELLPLVGLEAAAFALLTASGNIPEPVVTLFRALLTF